MPRRAWRAVDLAGTCAYSNRQPVIPPEKEPEALRMNMAPIKCNRTSPLKEPPALRCHLLHVRRAQMGGPAARRTAGQAAS